MLRTLVAASFLVGLVCASEAWGQIATHPDGQGYSQKIGMFTYHYRNGKLVRTDTNVGNTTFMDNANGTESTTTTVGSTVFYSDNRGTSGTEMQVGRYRYKSYSNFRQGWSGSGMSGPGYPSDYRRTYDGASAYQPLQPLQPLAPLPPLQPLPPLSW